MSINSIRNDEGFTLLETLIVLTVMVLLYSLVLQGIGSSYHRMTERTALQQMISDLRLLQAESKLKQEDSLQVIFLPAHSGGKSEYQLDLGYKVIKRELRGLKFVGEEQKRIVVYESVMEEDDRESASLRDAEYFSEADEVSKSKDLQEICFMGLSGREYSLLIYSGGDIEVSTGED